MSGDPTTLRRLYGRRQGHALRLGQQGLVDDLLPRLTVPEGPLDSATLFGDDRPLWLEIGFGAGEHLAGQAAANPDVGLIGCEPFLNGVVGALGHSERQGLTTVDSVDNCRRVRSVTHRPTSVTERPATGRIFTKRGPRNWPFGRCPHYSRGPNVCACGHYDAFTWQAWRSEQHWP